mgnify:CR=1 FL=1
MNDQQCRYTKLQWDSTMLEKEVCALGRSLNSDINQMMLFDPNTEMCKFFKRTYVNPRRWGVMIREKQIQDLLEKNEKANTEKTKKTKEEHNAQVKEIFTKVDKE